MNTDVEARAEARARVRSRLADLMERSMLEQVQDQIAPPSAPRERPTQPIERFANVELQSGPAWYVYGVINAAIGLEEPSSDVDASRPVQILTEGAVAAAVSIGRADCGLGILAAARPFGLDFVPVAREPYDLVVDAEAIDEPLLAPLWRLLDSAAFRAAVEDLGGYSADEMGLRIR